MAQIIFKNLIHNSRDSIFKIRDCLLFFYVSYFYVIYYHIDRDKKLCYDSEAVKQYQESLQWRQ